MRKGLPLTLAAGLALILFAAATVLVIGTYTFLPPLVESMVARNIREGLGLDERPQVELWSHPPPEMLVGRFSGGQVTMEGVEFGGVRAERVVVNLDPFDVDVLGSVMGGAVRSEEPFSGALRLKIHEEEISRLARAQADVPVRDVELERSQVVVEAEALGVEVPVSVRGDLVLREGELAFEPRRLSAFGTPVPERLAERLLAGADFAYPLEGLPYGAQITGAEVAEGRLVLSGEMERIPIS